MAHLVVLGYENKAGAVAGAIAGRLSKVRDS